MSDELPLGWKKAQTLGTILAAVLVPVVVGLVGHAVNQSVKENELSLSYIQLAVGILKDEPKPGTEGLRGWAIDVVNNYSSVKLSADAKEELKERPLPLIESTDRNPLTERVDFLRKNKGSAVASGQAEDFSISQHILLDRSGEPVSIVETQNTSGKLIDPKYIVMHFTAGSSAEATLKWIADAQAKASMHVLIDREGSVTQIVPFDYMAWHTGASQWEGLSGLNKYSIGISFSNAGPLTFKEGQWRTIYGRVIPDNEVKVEIDPSSGEKNGWHAYTAEQISAAEQVVSALVKQYPSIEDVLGHSDITSGRKNDPGPAFPIAKFKVLIK